MPPPQPSELLTLSLFTGAGGLDAGLEAAKFEVAGCVELDADCRRTLQANRPGWALVEPGDILTIEPKDLLAQLGVMPGDLALIAGGPPCQPFSKSSFWLTGEAPGMSDPRAETLRAYLRVLDEALPRAMLLENVKGIGFVGKDRAAEEQALEFLELQLAQINRRHGTAYHASVLHLDAADYGVPQHRERVFVFASRDGDVLTEPPATHGPRAQSGTRLTTAWDALAGLDVEGTDELRPRGRWADLLPSIPEGQNYQWHTPRGGGEPLFGWRTKFWSFLLKLAKDRPSWTIQAQPGPATGPFHWESRRLSVSEMAALQTFPSGYEITGSYGAARRQLGNAVPSALGELLGNEIRRQVFGHRVSSNLSLIPEQRDDRPPPGAPAAVPAHYLALRAEHAAHPGTGKGPAATKRAEEQQDQLDLQAA